MLLLITLMTSKKEKKTAIIWVGDDPLTQKKLL